MTILIHFNMRLNVIQYSTRRPKLFFLNVLDHCIDLTVIGQFVVQQKSRRV